MKDQSQMMNMNQHQMMNQPPMVNQQLSQQPLMVSQAPNPMMPQPQMVSQSYGQWQQQPPPNINMNAMKFHNPMNQMSMYGGGVPKPGRSNWKGKKPMDGRKDKRRKDRMMMMMAGGAGSGVGGAGGGGGYQPPNLHELEQQNRLKARRFYPKKKFNNPRMYAHAPRNTTSFIIRAKRAGGITSLVSPCPVTPAVLPTPVFSPSREALVDMAKEEWGVDGYGTMKGLIRLRSPGHDEAVDNYDEEDEEGSSESDVEELEEIEKRLDHDLSRFEMINPNSHNLENRVDDQDTHIAQLEEENLFLKEKVYLLERELGDLTRRLLFLERQNQVVEDINEEVVDNVSENDSDGVGNKEDGKDKPDFEFFGGQPMFGMFNDFVDGKPLQEQLSVAESKEHQSGDDDKGVGTADGVKVREHDEGVKRDVVGDICMGEAVAEKAGEHELMEGEHGKSDVNSKKDEAIVAGADVTTNKDEALSN